MNKLLVFLIKQQQKIGLYHETLRTCPEWCLFQMALHTLPVHVLHAVILCRALIPPDSGTGLAVSRACCCSTDARWKPTYNFISTFYVLQSPVQVGEPKVEPSNRVSTFCQWLAFRWLWQNCRWGLVLLHRPFSFFSHDGPPELICVRGSGDWSQNIEF